MQSVEKLKKEIREEVKRLRSEVSMYSRILDFNSFVSSEVRDLKSIFVRWLTMFQHREGAQELFNRYVAINKNYITNLFELVKDTRKLLKGGEMK
ncbi:MAG: hypothetical protein ACTSP1_11410 [Candidatus Freyarchaeota archaeon]